MSINVADVLVQARASWGAALKDQLATDPGEAVQLLWLSDALRLLLSTRPDAAIDDNGQYADYVGVSSATGVIAVSDKFRPALVHYTAAMGFDSDGENQLHQTRADKHFELWKALLGV